MNQFDDRDSPDDSAEPRHDEGIAEEISSVGQRVKGRVKDIAGEVKATKRSKTKGNARTKLAASVRRTRWRTHRLQGDM